MPAGDRLPGRAGTHTRTGRRWAEEHQRRHGHGAGPEPRRHARVDGHEQRQRQRHGGIRRRPGRTGRTAGGTGCCGSAWRAGTPRRRRRCRERRGGRGALRRAGRRRTAAAAEPWDGRSLLQVTHVLGLRMLQRILAPLVEVRKEESLTAFMMFAYSFLAMTAYNIIKPDHAVEVHHQISAPTTCRTSCWPPASSSAS